MEKDISKEIKNYLENIDIYSINISVKGVDFSEPLTYLPVKGKNILIGNGNGTINGKKRLDNFLLKFEREGNVKVISDKISSKTGERIIEYELPADGKNIAKPIELRIKKIGEFFDKVNFEKYVQSEGAFA